MKLFWHRLSSWWFTTMVPAYSPLTTIDARETVRKRRLFSGILLLAFLAAVLFTIQNVLNDATLLQDTESVIGWCVPLCALWINRGGYLKCASVLYFLLTLLTALTSIFFLALKIPVLSLYLWPVLLLLPICSGLFLPAWGPLLLGMLEIAFMYWFVHDGSRSQIALSLHDPQSQMQFLFLACTLILLAAVFSAIYAITTKKAVIQADRAIELEQAYAKLETAHATIQKQALTDGLTGLPNHRAVMDHLTKELERARRYGRPFSLLFFDADRFKRVNDTYGHAAGDAVLRQIGERASHVLRGGDTLGRFGGEEFVLLLPEADHQQASLIAERLRATVATEPLAISEVEGGLTMTVSIGLCSYPLDGGTPQALLAQADEAMYVAKRLGRNQVRTAEEARQMGTDVELMALLQHEGQHEATQREERTLERLRETYTMRMICSLMSLLEHRDQGLSAHAHAVSDLATTIAQTMGLESRQVFRIGLAALLHDIGKVAIPDRLLQKAGHLTTLENRLLHEHAELGAQILEASPFLSDLMPAVRHHHERWDGHGYPDQLAAEHIPQAARIIAVAEAYDAMRRGHVYQASRSSEETVAELLRHAGTQFDPTVVQVLQMLLISQQSQQPSPLMVG